MLLLERNTNQGVPIFSIASRIFLKDITRFRDETTLPTLFIEDGLAATHDLIPRSTRTVLPARRYQYCLPVESRSAARPAW